MSIFPETLYKYRIWNDKYQKKLLTDNEIYLASADQFNDPFDVALPFRYRDEDLTDENVFNKLLVTAKSMYPNLSDSELHQLCFERQQSGVFKNGQYWKDEYDRGRQMMCEKFGVLSLTTKNDNLLMWSHYSNSHRGFCVGLDTDILFNQIQGLIGSVKYTNEFPKIPLFGDPTNTMIDLLMTKSEEWKYEDEYRITKFDASKKIFNLPNEAFKEIILGLAISNNEASEITDLVKRKFPNIKIYQSQMNKEQFKLDLIPIV